MKVGGCVEVEEAGEVVHTKKLSKGAIKQRD